MFAVNIIEYYKNIQEKETLKKYYAVLIYGLLSAFCFPAERGIIFTDNLRIRNAPSITGKVIGTCIDEVVVEQNGIAEILYKNKIINIYEKSGTKTMKDGVFDYWYKISDTMNCWINAYYVALFPIYFRYAPVSGEEDYKIISIDETGLAHYLILDEYNSKNTIEKYDYTLYDELYKKMRDNSYLRLSEFIKDINEKLKIGELDLSSEPEKTKSFRLYTLPLLYDVKIAPDLKSLKEIFGWTRFGGRFVQDFMIIDLDKTYSLSVNYTEGEEQKIIDMTYYVQLRRN